MTGSTFEEITKSKPVRGLIHHLRKSGGRNTQGRITVRHRGGGQRRQWRDIDFKRNKYDIPAKVAAIEYDPNRSARIALLNYADGERRYIIAPLDLSVGDTIVTSPTVLLADEPTGNLDTKTSREIMDLLQGLNTRQGITVIMVTHESDIAAYAERTVRFIDGRIASDLHRKVAA